MKTFALILVIVLAGAVGYYALVGSPLAAPAESVSEDDAMMSGGQPHEAENPEGEADPSRMTLGMTTWRWIDSRTSEGSTISPEEEGVFTIDFAEDGTFSATTDCNAMSGTYTAEAGTVSFGPIAMTKKFCQGSQENDFAKSLSDASTYRFTNRGELILETDGGAAATFR